MNLLNLFVIATHGLRANRTRAFLTLLGIIIGVSTVIAMVSIVDGMNRYTYKVLGSIGSKTVYVQKWKWQIRFGGGFDRNFWRKIARRKDLTYEDAKAIAQLPSVEMAAPTRSLYQARKIKYRGKEVQIGNLVGSTSEYLPISGYDLREGRNFTEQDYLFRRQVCIIGDYIAENLFEGEDPLGKEVYIGRFKFIVIGVLKEKGQILGNNLDDIVIIPLSTLEKRFIRKRSWRTRVFHALSIMAKIKDEVPVEEGMVEIEELLRARRGLKFDEENDFGLNTQEMLVEAWKKLTTGIFLAMIGIASLALLVGGIGIMNIMLVTVTERTREIGVRMAVGAKRREILIQFLLEAVYLTVIGGLLGVFFGFAIAKFISTVTPLPASMPLWSVILGLGFSALVGLFFGIYPASKASKMDPIEALRYE